MNLLPSFPHEIRNFKILSIFSEALVSANDKDSIQVTGILATAESSEMSFLCLRGLLRVGKFLDLFFSHRTFNLGVERLCLMPLKAGTENKTVFFQSLTYLLEKTITAVSTAKIRVPLCKEKRKS